MKPYRIYRRRVARHEGVLAVALAGMLAFTFTGAQQAGATLLTYNSKYVVSSETLVSTISSTLVDDTEASQTFSLSASKTVLVIYSPYNNYGEAAWPFGGKQYAISVDGVDRANAWATGNGTPTGDFFYPDGATTFWIGTLAAGSHTIKGRFATQSAYQTVAIGGRVLLIYILDGDAFYYIDNNSVANTSSGIFVNDPNASQTFTPSANCKALMLYNTMHINGGQEVDGRKIAINLGGADYSQAEKASGSGNCYGENVLTLHYADLTGGNSYTANGRFARAGASGTARIDRRQMGILLFAESTLTDYVTSDTQVTTTSGYPVDDGQATINRTTTDSRELLTVAMGTKRAGTTSANHGEAYGIKVDGNDRAKSRASSAGGATANSASTAWAETLSAGSHTVQGRFGDNFANETAKIDSRRVVALWLATTPPVIAPTINNEGGASAIGMNGATLNGILTSDGGAPVTVTVYWGKSDGGTTKTAWEHEVTLGAQSPGPLTLEISGLTPFTTYRYRYYAQNSAGEDWADASTQFSTIGAASATIPGSDGGGVTADFNITKTEISVQEYVAFLNSLAGGDITLTSGEVVLNASSALLCYTTDKKSDAYVAYNSGANQGEKFSAVTDKSSHPMIYVTWFGAAAYCNWLSTRESLVPVYDSAGGWTANLANSGYRLPSEAQWLKAAAWDKVAGAFKTYGTSADTLAEGDANYLNSGDASENNVIRTTATGSYTTQSAYQLKDASGNVWEWCNDFYTGSDPDVDPHVARGGSWGNLAEDLKTTSRIGFKPEMALNSVGFRVAK